MDLNLGSLIWECGHPKWWFNLLHHSLALLGDFYKGMKKYRFAMCCFCVRGFCVPYTNNMNKRKVF